METIAREELHHWREGGRRPPRGRRRRRQMMPSNSRCYYRCIHNPNAENSRGNSPIKFQQSFPKGETKTIKQPTGMIDRSSLLPSPASGRSFVTPQQPRNQHNRDSCSSSSPSCVNPRIGSDRDKQDSWVNLRVSLKVLELRQCKHKSSFKEASWIMVAVAPGSSRDRPEWPHRDKRPISRENGINPSCLPLG